MRLKLYDTKVFRFEAAHNLVGYGGACANVHGHSYKLEVTVSGYIDPSSTFPASECMVMDFKDISSLVKRLIIDTHDHTDLNRIYPNPTAEYMVAMMFGIISKELPVDVTLESVKLWETENSYAEYHGEVKESE